MWVGDLFNWIFPEKPLEVTKDALDNARRVAATIEKYAEKYDVSQYILDKIYLRLFGFNPHGYGPLYGAEDEGEDPVVVIEEAKGDIPNTVEVVHGLGYIGFNDWLEDD